MILVIDNYDSFTYNLVQYIGTIDEDISVIRNDVKTITEIEAMKPEYIVISPGPGYPIEAGVTIDVIKRFSGKIPIFGVCLGCQAIAEAFGGDIVPAKELVHGKSTLIKHNGKGIFKGIKNPFSGARYHSLVIDPHTIPAELVITASTEDGEIMAVKHRKYPVIGVQFHPESILTENGMEIIKNFLYMVKNNPKH